MFIFIHRINKDVPMETMGPINSPVKGPVHRRMGGPMSRERNHMGEGPVDDSSWMTPSQTPKDLYMKMIQANLMGIACAVMVRNQNILTATSEVPSR